MGLHLAIIDDDLTLANTLRRELLEFPDIASIDIASSGISFAHELPKSTRVPDVVLMDISMKMADEGILATRMLHDKYPQIKVVMFTMSEDDSNIFEAFKSGSVGYLLKNEKPAFIYKTIIDVSLGGALMSPGVAIKAIRFLSGEATKLPKGHGTIEELSERELEVLKLVAKGHTYHSMAEAMFISSETVKKHMSNIFKKLQVKNKIEAINKTKEWL
jgi:DNA-binding NarL/FixJ family response regulator